MKNTSKNSSEEVKEPFGAYAFIPGVAQALSSVQKASALKQGLQADQVNRVMQYFNMTQQELAETLHITPKTLRKKIQQNENFDPLTGSLIIELQDLYARGEKLFGSRQTFLHWLHHPNSALGNLQPFSLLDTFQGIRTLYSELDSIADGSYA